MGRSGCGMFGYQWEEMERKRGHGEEMCHPRNTKWKYRPSCGLDVIPIIGKCC